MWRIRLRLMGRTENFHGLKKIFFNQFKKDYLNNTIEKVQQCTITKCTLHSDIQNWSYVEIIWVQLCLGTIYVVGFVVYHLQTFVICTTFAVYFWTIGKGGINNHRYVEITTFGNSHILGDIKYLQISNICGLIVMLKNVKSQKTTKFKLSSDKFWQVTKENKF